MPTAGSKITHWPHDFDILYVPRIVPRFPTPLLFAPLLAEEARARRLNTTPLSLRRSSGLTPSLCGDIMGPLTKFLQRAKTWTHRLGGGNGTSPYGVAADDWDPNSARLLSVKQSGSYASSTTDSQHTQSPVASTTTTQAHANQAPAYRSTGRHSVLSKPKPPPEVRVPRNRKDTPKSDTSGSGQSASRDYTSTPARRNIAKEDDRRGEGKRLHKDRARDYDSNKESSMVNHDKLRRRYHRDVTHRRSNSGSQQLVRRNRDVSQRDVEDNKRGEKRSGNRDRARDSDYRSQYSRVPRENHTVSSSRNRDRKETYTQADSKNKQVVRLEGGSKGNRGNSANTAVVKPCYGPYYGPCIIPVPTYQCCSSGYPLAPAQWYGCPRGGGWCNGVQVAAPQYCAGPSAGTYQCGYRRPEMSYEERVQTITRSGPDGVTVTYSTRDVKMTWR